MTDDRKPSDQELRRLLAIGKSTAVHSNGFEFLRWVRLVFGGRIESTSPTASACTSSRPLALGILA